MYVCMYVCTYVRIHVRNRALQVAECFYSYPTHKQKQHGFTPGQSVESNLSVLLNSVACDINAKAQTDVVYTDFIKAFDSVNQRFLLHKLKLFGFSGNLLQ